MWLTKRAKTKIVKETVDVTLKKIGYPEMQCGDIDRGNFWYSKVQEGDLRKVIAIYDCYNILQLVFKTNAYGQEPLYADKDNVGVFTQTEDGTWDYKTCEEFSHIILIYKDLIKNSAIIKLEELSVPTVEARPTKESNRYLYENHEQLNAECMKKWELNGKSAEEIWDYLEERIQESRKKEFKDVEYQLVEIAAVYGTTLIREYGGEWVWNTYFNNAIISNIGCDKLSSYPLNQIITHWRDEMEFIVFRNLLRNYR